MPHARPRYLVTGAAGFIGSWIARHLMERKDAEVWTIDNLSSGLKANLHPDVKFIQGDCENLESIAKLENRRFDAIIHLAGQSSGEISFDDPRYDLVANTESTLLLIQYALRTGSQRFIYASSMGVYGATPDRPIGEDYPPRPASFYAVSKLASEHYLRIFEPKGLRPTALRFFTVYGPHQNLSNLRQGMVSIFLAELLFADKVVVKGSLDRFRDLVYITDVVNAAVGVLDSDRAVGKIYNVGTGVKTTVGELLQKLAQISGIEKEIVCRGRTEGDIHGIYADISRIGGEVGYTPRTPLDTGLREMVAWAKTVHPAFKAGAVESAAEE